MDSFWGMTAAILEANWMDWSLALIFPLMYCVILVFARRENREIDLFVALLAVLLPLAVIAGSVEKSATQAVHNYTLRKDIREIVLGARVGKYCVPGGHLSAADLEIINQSLRQPDLTWVVPGEFTGRKLGPKDPIPCDLNPTFDADAFVGYSAYQAIRVGIAARVVQRFSIFFALLLLIGFFPGAGRYNFTISLRGKKAVKSA